MFSIFSDRSPKWNGIRSKHIERQPYCQACGSRKKLEVHHIEPYHIKPERELEPTNLITLCKTCHLVFGHLMDYKSWNINVVEDCSQYYSKLKKRPYHETFSYQNNYWTLVIYKLISWYNRSFNSR